MSELGAKDFASDEHLEDAIAALLDDPSPFLRGEAAKPLLAGWKREKYVDRVGRFLLEDRSEDWVGRADAAFAPGQFAHYTGKRRDEIIRVLVRALANDSDPAVQSRSWEQLLQQLAPDRHPRAEDEFDRERDVDWALFEPYR